MKPVEELSGDIGGELGGPRLGDLLDALCWLDGLLGRAVSAAQAAYGPEAASDPYRGLYVNQAEAERLLARRPGTPPFAAEADATPPGADLDQPVPGLAWLGQAFALTPFDLAVIVIALAPEIDLRYERLYAYLQDDVTRKRPTVDLALNLLCTSAEARLGRFAHFAPDAPLLGSDLLHLVPDPNQVRPPLLAHYLKLDEQILHLLLGQDSLDARLAPFSRLVDPGVSLEDLPLSPEVKQALAVLAVQARTGCDPLRLYFQGPRGAGKRRTAEALAGEIAARLLAVDLPRALGVGTDFERVLKRLFREAWLHGAVLYLDGLDALRGEDRAADYQRLLTELAQDAGITILAGTEPWVGSSRDPTGVLSISFPIPDAGQRRAHWEWTLAELGIRLDGADLEELAGRFRLTPGQIAEAALTARNSARWPAASRPSGPSPAEADGQPTVRHLFAAARAQSGHGLASLAHKIEPVATWDDIVLPDDALAQLRELCQRTARGPQVLGAWGFGRRLSRGKGSNALFAGSSGTGKTMAAEIVAGELGLDLYMIDLAGVVSKWIGETEKNLDRIFRAAEDANAILFFDEADALFGKRSEVRDSHDRYANLEISYLLQKIEQYDGVAILATNLRQHLDEAFVRRLAFTVAFPFPDEVDRRRIWARVWPSEVPLAGDVDLDFLARQFKLSGGNIKNVALAAAFLAAGEAVPVAMRHLLHAVRREYQKMGKVLSGDELNGTPTGTQP